MNCETPVFTIFTGDAKTMKFRVAYKNTYLPFDLTSASEIIVNLPKADGTLAQRKLSLAQVAITSPAVLGQFSCPIPDDLSPLLNIGELQNVDVAFTVGGAQTTVRYYGVLSVFEGD
jgi:hypothetical protein